MKNKTIQKGSLVWVKVNEFYLKRYGDMGKVERLGIVTKVAPSALKRDPSARYQIFLLLNKEEERRYLEFCTTLEDNKVVVVRRGREIRLANPEKS